MKKSKVLRNIVVSLIYQFVNIICAFIVPRLIMDNFGSSYNGINSAVAQLLNCIILLKGGITSVTIFALYKPLANKDDKKVSSILVATNVFMKKVSIIFSVFLLLLATLYPFVVIEEFKWSFTCLLILISGASVIIQNYFGLKYQMLLIADEKRYIYTSIQIITTIINTILIAILVSNGSSFNIMKLGSTIVFILNPIILKIYVNKRYRIIENIEPNFEAINKRWDAFAREVAVFINTNTDLVILSIFVNAKEMSVYTIYYLVINGIKTVMFSISDGFTSHLGKLVAKGEKEILLKDIRRYEFIIFNISTIVFTATALLIVPFISIYTKGINDINYLRPLFGGLVAMSGYITSINLPYQDLIKACGYFKENRNVSIIECIINIIFSIIFVEKMGIVGVTIGTILALTFRMIMYIMFICSKFYEEIHVKDILKRIIISILEIITIIFVVNKINILNLIDINGYVNWIIYSIYITTISLLVVFIYNILFFNLESKVFLQKNLKGKLKKYRV